MTPISLDLFSDPVCPWCYIGATELIAALAERRGHPFVLAFHPFQLNPDMPRGGLPYGPYMAEKFGGAERFAPALERVKARAAEMGLPYAPEKISRAANTLDAHRLIHWAGLEGCQMEVALALARGFHAEGRDLNQPEVLADIAAEQGMDREAVLRLLGSQADRDDIAARDADARAKGVSGVPLVLVARHYAVSGAQGKAFWLRAFDELAAQG